MKASVVFLIVTLFAIQAASGASLGDPNGKGHPLIHPYTGSVLVDQYHENHGTFRFPLELRNFFGRVKQYTEIEGELTRLIYDGPADKTPAEIVANYQSALEKAGLKAVKKGTDQPDPNFRVKVFLEALGADGLNVCYAFNAKRAKYVVTSGTVQKRHLVVAVVTDYCKADGRIKTTADKPRTIVWIAEQRALEGGKVKVDATALWHQIRDNGHASVYGIEFDFDSANIRSESAPVLQEVAKLLRQQPKLDLYVVGHTDMQGTLDYNADLSRRRAHSVLSWLVEKEKIATARLEAHGVGFLAPIATNRSPEGQAINRRVALIEKTGKK